MSYHVLKPKKMPKLPQFSPCPRYEHHYLGLFNRPPSCAANQCAAQARFPGGKHRQPGGTETVSRADHVTMAQGHHLLEGAIANASPEASQARQGFPKTRLES